MIYADFTDCIPYKTVKFHGGGNYAKRYIELLAKSGKYVKVIVPSYYHPSENDLQFFSQKNLELVVIDNMEKFQVEEKDSILFIPLLRTRRTYLLKKIKENNPKLRIYWTIHGDRALDLVPDKMDAYYFDGVKKLFYMPYAWIKYIVYRTGYHYVLKKYMPYCDRLYTVSNDSMQKIQRFSTPIDIKPFFEGSINSDVIMQEPIDCDKENYMLFVSGDREEKNLLRSLVAFQEFKKEDKSGIRLVVTGVNENLERRFLKCPLLDSKLIDANVVFKKYVDSEEFSRLYKKCKFILYPSKSEGFGLPLVEACMYGVPVLTSSITALPEVLGSSISYVNPYNIESIANGLRNITTADYKRLQDKIIRKRENIILNIKNSDLDFLSDF